MAQKRFFNWKDDDLTASLNSWRLGINEAGLYRGFDLGTMQGLQLTLNHEKSGYRSTSSEGELTPKQGIIVSRQGAIIVEDEAIVIPMVVNPFDVPRKYLIIIEHEYTRVVGGTQGVYTYIAGGADGLVPEPTANTDTILGVLTMPAGATGLADSVYVRAETPDFSGVSDRYVRKYQPVFGADVDMGGFIIANLNYPSNLYHAANVEYVETRIIDNLTPKATTTVEGKAEIATQTETNSGESADKIVTPSTLEGRTATQARAGILKLATNTEALESVSTILGISPATLTHYLVTGNYVQDGNYVHTDTNFTQAEKDKLADLGAQQQSDFNITSTSDARYIRNRPALFSSVNKSIQSNGTQLFRLLNSAGSTIGSIVPDMNEDILFQCFLRDGTSESNEVGSSGISEGFGIDADGEGNRVSAMLISEDYNVSAANLVSSGEKIAIEIQFNSALPNFYGVTVEVMNSRVRNYENLNRSLSETLEVGVVNATVTTSVIGVDNSRCWIGVNEYTGVKQSVGLWVTGRRTRQANS